MKYGKRFYRMERVRGNRGEVLRCGGRSRARLRRNVSYESLVRLNNALHDAGAEFAYHGVNWMAYEK